MPWGCLVFYSAYDVLVCYMELLYSIKTLFNDMKYIVLLSIS